jgi:Mlc titration factor MtfA (ptsG expression regulator)
MAPPFLSRLWRRQLTGISEMVWGNAIQQHPCARRLVPDDKKRLVSLAGQFLRAKPIEGAHGLNPTGDMCAHIAVRACLPILELGLDYYSEWYAVVLYPADFRVEDEYADEAGVVHRGTRELCGESMTQGPMVLSWPAIEEDMAHADLDLVIHECAHKIDLLNGDADGYPPLHADMDSARWTGTFQQAYDDLCRIDNDGGETPIDPYAASDPAEFFAVASETFFVAPWQLTQSMPDVYQQLRRFYRQDPGQLFRLA